MSKLGSDRAVTSMKTEAGESPSHIPQGIDEDPKNAASNISPLSCTSFSCYDQTQF
jgi:hypothetical protein